MKMADAENKFNIDYAALRDQVALANEKLGGEFLEAVVVRKNRAGVALKDGRGLIQAVLS